MKILLATDGSESAVEAARFFSRLPHAEPLEVAVNTTVMLPTIHTTGGTSTLPDQFQQAEASYAQEHFEQIEALFEGADSTLTHRITQGHAGECIVEQAEDFGADLIVLGAKGHSVVHRILLGSVSDYVATHAKCSVLVVRAPAQNAKINVTIAYDGSPRAKAALGQFCKFRWGPTSDVHLLSVVPIVRAFGRELLPNAIFDRAVQRDAALKIVKHAAECIADAAPHAIVNVVESEHPGEAIVQFLEDQSSDLVVIGDTGRSAIGRMLMGSKSRFVLHHARCSVWIVRANSHTEKT